MIFFRNFKNAGNDYRLRSIKTCKSSSQIETYFADAESKEAQTQDRWEETNHDEIRWSTLDLDQPPRKTHHRKNRSSRNVRITYDALR